MAKPKLAALAWIVCASLSCSSKNADPLPAETPISETGAPDDAAPIDAPVTPPPTLSDETKATLDAYLDAEQKTHGYPSMAFGIVIEDTLVWKRGVGTRNGKPTGAAIDENTVFRIGSITKVITGAAILKLRDAKKLDLDDPVDKWIPEVATTVSPAGKPKVTIRNLVTHTSGIPRNGDGTADFTRTDRDLTEAELLDSVKKSTLVFTPGTRFEYSNFGFALAGIIVGRAAGKPYRDYVTESFLTPLSMASSGFAAPSSTSNFALGNWLDRDGYVLAGAPWRIGAAEGMGGMYSTVSDLARFVAFEGRANTAFADFDAVLSRETLRESQETQPITKSLSAKVGVSWFTVDHALGRAVWHNGSTIDYSAFALLAPARRAAVVGLLGTGDAGTLDCIANQVLLAATEKRTPTSCKPYLGKGNAIAIDRVRALIAKADEAGIDAAFSPEFVKSASRAELIAFFDGVRAQLGTCSASQHLATSDSGAARFRLTCEKLPGAVLLAARDESPNLIVGLYIDKAK